MTYRLTSVSLSYGDHDGPKLDVLVMVPVSDNLNVTLDEIEKEIEASETLVKEALRPFLNNKTFMAVNGVSAFIAPIERGGVDALG